MQARIKLVQSNSAIRTAMLNALMSDVNQTINKSLPIIEAGIKSIVEQAIKSEPEYNSLIGGILRYEFGIADVTIVDKVIQALMATLVVNKQGISITGAGLRDGFKITMIGQGDLNNIINSGDGVVTDLRRFYNLPWLKWLLLEGTRPIVKNYEVQLGPNPESRTGYAVMVESEGVNWAVPAQFAGTISSNWITRALSRCEKNITKLIQQTIENNV
jgi:hypothetical protein